MPVEWNPRSCCLRARRQQAPTISSTARTPSVAVEILRRRPIADANGTGSPNGLAVAPSAALIPLLRRFHMGPQIARGKTLPVKSRHFCEAFHRDRERFLFHPNIATVHARSRVIWRIPDNDVAGRN